MELSFSLNYLMQDANGKKYRSIEDAAKYCRQAGFRYVDYSADLSSDNWETKAYHDREVLDQNGITVVQTHAPFNRYRKTDEELFPVHCRRSYYASKILGAKYVVVHADEYPTRDRYDENEILEYTYDYLAPYVDLASELGLVVAVENVFEDKSWRYGIVDGKSRYTSRVEELKAVIERFSSQYVRCCWDFGHAKCAYGENMTDALKVVGEYVVCTHVHDNYHNDDLHVVPFLGDTDWQKNMDVLRDSGYKGNLSFELVYGKIPDESVPLFLNFVYSTGKILAGMFEKNK